LLARARVELARILLDSEPHLLDTNLLEPRR
jgi:hypothetical protein